MAWIGVLLFSLSCGQILAGFPGYEQDPFASPQQEISLLGDIKLTDKQKNAIKNGEDVGSSSGNAFAASNRPTLRWPNGIIPYEIDCSLEHMPSAIEAITKAIAQWERKTCLRFVKHTNEKDYLQFFRNTHCWGHVGRIGGRSQISVGPGCDYEHVMAHEIGHTVGFWHEQNRMDRDNYVTVHWDNIEDWVKSAFDKVKDSDDYGVPYDYASIMHYPWHAFTKNGKNTMSPKKTVNIQPYIAVSDGDALQISRMYKCSSLRKRRSTANCRDQQSTKNCQAWASRNGCKNNAGVLNACQLTCKSPNCDTSVPCVDRRNDCKSWANIGYCRTSTYVQFNCPKSCADRCKGTVTVPPATTSPKTPPPPPKTTPSVTNPPVTAPPNTGPLPTTKSGGVRLGIGLLCLDKHPSCPKWAGWGECKKNPGYMLKNCKLSCNQTDCDRGIQKPPGTCNEPLGIAWDGKTYKLPDSAMTAASVLSPGGGWSAAGNNARLYYHDDYTNKRIAAWCIKTWDDFKNGAYLQVDLGKVKNIQYIATQGRDKYFERVGQYKVTYSVDGRSFQPYTENGKQKTFDGNCDHFTPILNKFSNRINARFVRVYPTKANYPCMRMELYGC